MAKVVQGFVAASAAAVPTVNPAAPAAPAVALTDGEGNLVSFAAGSGIPVASTGAQVGLTYATQARTASFAGDTLATTQLASLAVDVNVTAFAGGSSPSVTFFLNRLGADGLWYQVWSSGTISTVKAVSASIGPGQSGGASGAGGFSAVLSTQAQFGWTFAGTPTSITFSASVVGRP